MKEAMKRTLSSKQLKQIIAFARNRVKANDFNHNIDHMELTVRIARILARQEGADEEVCLAASYLHDIGRKKARGRHGKDGARIARAFLKQNGFPAAFINAVCYAIGQHDSGSAKKTKEAAVLWDADKLQAVGPFGFIRIFAHHLTYDTRDIYLAKRMTQRRIDFFYRRFYTKSGKILARRLHNYLNKFCELADIIRQGKLEKIN